MPDPAGTAGSGVPPLSLAEQAALTCHRDGGESLTERSDAGIVVAGAALLELEESGFAVLHAGRVTIDQGREPGSTLLDLTTRRGLCRKRLPATDWLLVVAREGIREAALEQLRARGILVGERGWLRLVGLEPRYRVQDAKPGEATRARLSAAAREGSDGNSQVVVRLARLLAAAGCPGMAVERAQVHAEPEDEVVNAVREAAARARTEISAMLLSTPAAGVASVGLAGFDQTVLRGWGQRGPLNHRGGE